MELETIQARVHGSADLPTVIYLPGLHGDWTLVSSFRCALRGRARFVEFTYPRRSGWNLEDYAMAVMEELRRHEISSGWVLAESFGSQVAWQMIEQCSADRRFEVQGLILAGGFVRHPVIFGVHLFHAIHRLMPWWMSRLFLRGYVLYARLRHRRAPETLASIGEFQARRTRADGAAIGSRYPLIARADFRALACRTEVPVYALTGFFDPIVPWWFVLPWLRRNCRALRGSRILFNADHQVLGTAPARAADQVMAWINAETTTATVTTPR